MADNRLPLYGPLVLRGNKIEGLADGEASSDAVNLSQLEGRLEAGATFPPTPVNGDAFQLTVNVGDDQPGVYVYDGTDWVPNLPSLDVGSVWTWDGNRYIEERIEVVGLYDTDSPLFTATPDITYLILNDLTASTDSFDEGDIVAVTALPTKRWLVTADSAGYVEANFNEITIGDDESQNLVANTSSDRQRDDGRWPTTEAWQEARFALKGDTGGVSSGATLPDSGDIGDLFSLTAIDATLTPPSLPGLYRKVATGTTDDHGWAAVGAGLLNNHHIPIGVGNGKIAAATVNVTGRYDRHSVDHTFDDQAAFEADTTTVFVHRQVVFITDTNVYWYVDTAGTGYRGAGNYSNVTDDDQIQNLIENSGSTAFDIAGRWPTTEAWQIENFADIDGAITADATLSILGVTVEETGTENLISFDNNADLRHFIDAAGLPELTGGTHVLAAGSSVNIRIVDAADDQYDFSIGQIGAVTNLSYVYATSTTIGFELAAADFGTSRTGTLRYVAKGAPINNIEAGSNITLDRRGRDLIINSSDSSSGDSDVTVNSGALILKPNFTEHGPSTPAEAAHFYSPAVQQDENTADDTVTDVSIQIDQREILPVLQEEVRQILEELSNPGGYEWVEEDIFETVFLTNRTNSSGTLDQTLILQPHFVDTTDIFTTYAVLTGTADTGDRSDWNGASVATTVIGFGPDLNNLIAFQLISTFYRDTTAAGLAEIKLKMIDPDGIFAGATPIDPGVTTNKQQFVSWISDNDDTTSTNPVVHSGISTYYYETDNDFLDVVRHDPGSHITGSSLTADERELVDGAIAVGDNLLLAKDNDGDIVGVANNFSGTNVWNAGLRNEYLPGQTVRDTGDTVTQDNITSDPYTVFFATTGATGYVLDPAPLATATAADVTFAYVDQNPLLTADLTVVAINHANNTVDFNGTPDRNFRLTYPPTNFGDPVGANTRLYVRNRVPYVDGDPDVERPQTALENNEFNFIEAQGVYQSAHWIALLINGEAWREHQIYLRGDVVDYVDSNSIPRLAHTGIRHLSTGANAPFQSDAIQHETPSTFTTDTPWEPVGAAIDVSMGAAQDADQLVDGTTEFTVLGRGVDAGRWFVVLREEGGVTGSPLPAGIRPNIGDNIAFGAITNASGDDIPESENYEIVRIENDTAAVLYFEGDEIPTEVEDILDRPGAAEVNVFVTNLRTDLGQIDRFIFNDQDFVINTDNQNIGHAHISSLTESKDNVFTGSNKFNGNFDVTDATFIGITETELIEGAGIEIESVTNGNVKSYTVRATDNILNRADVTVPSEKDHIIRTGKEESLSTFLNEANDDGALIDFGYEADNTPSNGDISFVNANAPGTPITTVWTELSHLRVFSGRYRF